MAAFRQWPPSRGVTPQRLYFQARHGAVVRRADGQRDSGFDSYVSDPAHPVPYRQRPIPPTYYPGGSGWTTWLVQDQRFVDGRPDVLTYETAAADDTMSRSLAAITAHLFAVDDGLRCRLDREADRRLSGHRRRRATATLRFGGYELMVANDVFRGRFRESFTTPQPIPPNHVDEYTIDLHTQDYRFLKGHRIMVQVQSTWFPIIDRNPQHYVPNIFRATESDFRVARERIYRTGAHASYLELPIETTPTTQ